MTTSRAVCDIAGNLRINAYCGTHSVSLLAEAADKLDELLALLVQAEIDRDEALAQIARVRAQADKWKAAPPELDAAPGGLSYAGLAIQRLLGGPA